MASSATPLYERHPESLPTRTSGSRRDPAAQYSGPAASQTQRVVAGDFSRGTIHADSDAASMATSRLDILSKVPFAGGRCAIYADTDEINRLKRLRDAPRGWQQTYPKDLTTPKRE